MNAEKDKAPFIAREPVGSTIIIVLLAISIIVFIIVFIRRFRQRYHPKALEKQASTESFDTLVKRHSTSQMTLSPLEEIKISLPLPPPSTSFFSDKMELADDDLYKYMSMPKKTSNFSANLQRTASTVKKTVYQSIRKPGNAVKPAGAQTLFEHVRRERPVSQDGMPIEDARDERRGGKENGGRTSIEPSGQTKVDSQKMEVVMEAESSSSIDLADHRQERPASLLLIPSLGPLLEETHLSLNEYGSSQRQASTDEPSVFLDDFPVPDVGSWAGRKSGASIVKHTQEDMN
ncbi:hypothetical protein G6F57_003200 [Rhizopus arrhizus]|uniref:Uncharacterized protein n=1 Tax=Rhizopus oryzae TaxID=64495 RepID=A0A9P6XEN6_RHIOR|nr:hypothetical protein G6F23_009337 [Rhizopus arrhizus]KAG1428183.1 hypothetical protein G6F58_000696 [Rhizopus delemar]KAG0767311.1 hypothetical protein G6F24_002890 [Rhizopus arrhizus]KAG0795746.1 hypothetical protein G6F21_001859 [Rhizopus arrhizus]KAG0816987.1 hypothetical protein G6F20_002752 [Rhizopus arrhizus]